MGDEKELDAVTSATPEGALPPRHESKLDAVHEHDAVGYREYVEGLDTEISDKEARRVRWKIDLIILPVFLITQALQFMDKTALNYANLFGYQAALGLQGQQFNYLSAMVYAGYFFGQYPCGWLIGRYPAQKVIAVSILLWGIMVLVMTQCRTFSSALAVRFIMGVFEAAVTPGMTLMTGFWWTRREIPLRQCIWYSALGWGGIIGSYISMGVSTLPADMTPERWQLIFYILGAVTCLWSFVVFFFLPDAPSSARFFNHRERVVAVKRVSSNETGIKNKSFNKKQALLAFYDPKAIILFISVFAAAIPNGVVNSFSTVIIRDMGFSTTKTTELKSVGDAVQIVALFIGGIITLNVPNSRLLTSTAANILCTVCAGLMAYLPRSNTWGRLVSFWLVNAQSVGFTISLTTISSNMAGYTHRSFASAIIFTAYCWGNFAGPFVVKESEAPEYKGATIGLLVGYAIKLGCHLALLLYMFLSNRRRDRTYGLPNKGISDEAGMQDKTEFQNKDFRYVL
ncbi:major facilitator superfamily domain-containing protein [Xylariales sp. AK1849]|nr:major facilitator superfamily domain-containing protein [Xylariales sp. AK1849]